MNAPLTVGFADPVHDAQRAFRAVLDALARPGRAVHLGDRIDGLAIQAAMARLLLTLTDDDTAVWWQRSEPAAARWLRFHTGATVAAGPDQAAFAVIAEPQAMPPLAAFAQGTDAAPELSTTLLIEVPLLDGGTALQWHGPGLREPLTVRIAGMPAAFWNQWQANHAAFPQGVDVVFTCGAQAIGLPRTTRVGRLEGI
jgi:alpha-D-ribose 1-methylphosphonate 5-triphosphate synthase subunit PhnH